jgi:putative hydrolase of the HAD superfamily
MSTNKMRKNQLVCVFDFDGVLIDSYSCLPLLYKSVAYYIGFKGNNVNKFIKRALEYEDEQDAEENYNRKSWWPLLFKEFEIYRNIDLHELLKNFEEERIKKSKILKNTVNTLKWLKEKGAKLIILASSDGTPNLKKRRIKESGLMEFFDEVFIVNEDIKNRKEGLKSILKRYKVSENQVIFIDDKPGPINEIQANFKDVMTIKMEFRGPLRLAWEKEKCMPTYKIKTINELRKILSTLERKNF